jgi:hypothetical protein
MGKSKVIIGGWLAKLVFYVLHSTSFLEQKYLEMPYFPKVHTLSRSNWEKNNMDM